MQGNTSLGVMLGSVHNVKNASKTEPAKALAFYVTKKGIPLEELSVPAK
jgi:hypothetical protein